MTLLNNKNFIILGFESLLFSGVFGIAYHSWLVFGIMFLGLSLLLKRSKNMVYIIVALSLLWGFIAFSIGYSSGEWIWGVTLGVIFFLFGVGAHLKNLKRPMDSMAFWDRNTDEWRRVLRNLN